MASIFASISLCLANLVQRLAATCQLFTTAIGRLCLVARCRRRGGTFLYAGAYILMYMMFFLDALLNWVIHRVVEKNITDHSISTMVRA